MMNGFDFRGGDVALDFTNTVRSRAGDAPRELLRSYDDLVEWAKRAGVIEGKRAAALRRLARRSPRAATRALRRARDLREAIYAAFTGRGIDVTTIDAYVRNAMRYRTLAVRRGRVMWSWPQDSLYEIEWRIADAAAALLTSEKRHRVRACNGTRCRWLFIDNSRAANRRWCDMRVCGNREKARRHHARKRA